MDTNKITQMIRIAKMHYELNRTQLEIAKKEGISKATVSRILKSAMDKGIIEVRIKDSILNDTALEKDLIDAYPIKRAVIVPDLVENEQILLQDVCAALIDDLPRYVKNDSVIGVFYGHTLTALTRQLPKIKRKGVSVIQLAGGFSRAVYESNSLSTFEVCRLLWWNCLSDSCSCNGRKTIYCGSSKAGLTDCESL